MKIRIEPARTRILGSFTMEAGTLVITPRPMYPGGPIYVAELTAIGAGGAKCTKSIYFSTRTGRFSLCDVPDDDDSTMFDESIEVINARRGDARANAARFKKHKNKAVSADTVVNEGTRTVSTDADGGSSS